MKTAFIHHLAQLGEKSVSAIAATLRLGGFDAVTYKTSQGSGWMGGRFDSSPLAPKNVAELAQLRVAFAAEGIKLEGWHVLDGSDPVAEARFLKPIADVLQGIELDCEPFKGANGTYEFFRLDVGQLRASIDALVAAGVVFDIDADFRDSSGGWSAFGPGQMAYACSKARRVRTQSYWTDFKLPWRTTLDRVLVVVREKLAYQGPLGIIFPWDGHRDYGVAWDYLTERGISDVGLWRMGFAGPKTYAAFKALHPVAVTPDDSAVFVARVRAAPSIKVVLDESWSLAAGQRVNGDPAAAASIEATVVRIKELAGL